MPTRIAADQVGQNGTIDKILERGHDGQKSTLIAPAGETGWAHELYDEYIPGFEDTLSIYLQRTHGHAQQIAAGCRNRQMSSKTAVDAFKSPSSR